MVENNPDCPGGKPPFLLRLLGRVGINIEAEKTSATETRTRGQKIWRASVSPRFFFFIIGLAGVTALLMTGASFYSTKPSFCNKCHIMEPYYNAWAGSNHKFVRCVDCHYPPGAPGDILWHKFQALSQVVKYVTRTYSSKPFAEIQDAACLRGECHSNRLLQGRVISKSGIFFDHQPHLEKPRYGQQLRCVSCHSQIVIGTHMEVTWDTCYLCHFLGHKGERKLEPIGGCRGCHLVPEEEIKVDNATFMHKDFVREGRENCQECHLEILKGDGEVSKQRCVTCHNQPEKLGRFEESEFLHDNHVTRHHIACFHCHNEIRHGYTIRRAPEQMISDCGRCHSNLHDLEGELYQGLGAKGVERTPSPMFSAGVDCSACHLQKKDGDHPPGHAFTYEGTETGCTNCHDFEFEGMNGEVKVMVTDTLAKLSQKMALVQEAMKTATLDEKTTAMITEKLGEAEYNLKFASSTHSLHNIYYLSNALEYSEKVITASAKKLGLAEPAERTSALPFISGGYCAVLCHNRLGVDVPPRSVTFDNITVPHDKHVEEGLSCRVCHEFGAHNDVKFKGAKVCEKCHSKEQMDKLKAPPAP